VSTKLENADRGGHIRDYIDTHGHWLDYKIEHEFTNGDGQILPPRGES
jgi:hypothetical protein